MAYFERIDGSRFRATEHTGGAWDTAMQHIAPALGLLAHSLEQDRDRRRTDGLVLTRLSYDILGPVPIDVVEVSIDVIRPGRSIELVEARLVQGGRDVVVLRAWLQATGETADVAGGATPTVPGPEATAGWDPTTVWPGGFIASVDVRRQQAEPGRATVWARTDLALVAGEEASPLARAMGLCDIANGMTVREDPTRVAFPNIDLTAHVYRQPRAGWLGLDTTVTFGADAVGLTSSVLHDETGPFGMLAQVLTVRPT